MCVQEFMLCYMDDLVMVSSAEIENATKIHATLIEFILFCTKRYGLKLARNKTNLMVKKFKFLGFEFKNSANSISTKRKNSFLTMRAPRSQA